MHTHNEIDNILKMMATQTNNLNEEIYGKKFYKPKK